MGWNWLHYLGQLQLIVVADCMKSANQEIIEKELIDTGLVKGYDVLTKKLGRTLFTRHIEEIEAFRITNDCRLIYADNGDYGI